MVYRFCFDATHTGLPASQAVRKRNKTGSYKLSTAHHLFSPALYAHSAGRSVGPAILSSKPRRDKVEVDGGGGGCSEPLLVNRPEQPKCVVVVSQLDHHCTIGEIGSGTEESADPLANLCNYNTAIRTLSAG